MKKLFHYKSQVIQFLEETGIKESNCRPMAVDHKGRYERQDDFTKGLNWIGVVQALKTPDGDTLAYWEDDDELIEELRKRLSFEEGLKSITMVFDAEIEDDMTVLVACLEYRDGYSLTVPFVFPRNEVFLFTPWDWQSIPEEMTDARHVVENIDEIEWRVNDTEYMAIILNGAPRVLLT